MKASRITQTINHLEDARDILASEYPDSNDIVVLESMINDLKDRVHPLIENLQETCRMLKERKASLLAKSRINLFENWQPNEETMILYQNLFKSYVNWEYPGLEVFPGTGSCLPHALGSEPLYIADWDRDLMDLVSEQFNRYYANKRLMKYQIQGLDLSPLPQNSFGVIWCFNWLRFEDDRGLHDILQSAHGCLMPGGIFMFNYNPSDKWWGVESMERGFSSGVDSKLLMEKISELGMTVVDQRDHNNLSYIICKKAGDIEYIKESSIIAKIIDRQP